MKKILSILLVSAMLFGCSQEDTSWKEVDTSMIEISSVSDEPVDYKNEGYIDATIGKIASDFMPYSVKKSYAEDNRLVYIFNPKNSKKVNYGDFVIGFHPNKSKHFSVLSSHLFNINDSKYDDFISKNIELLSDLGIKGKELEKMTKLLENADYDNKKLTESSDKSAKKEKSEYNHYVIIKEKVGKYSIELSSLEEDGKKDKNPTIFLRIVDTKIVKIPKEDKKP